MKHSVVVWKVHCPKDGPQVLSGGALHVYVREGLSEHVVTYFCPDCREQRFQLINKKATEALVEEMGIHWTLLQVPLEALEIHYAPPLTQAYIDKAIESMARPDWPKL